ncbi:MAG: insulinase family protein [Elusimicrobiales bacterium]
MFKKTLSTISVFFTFLSGVSAMSETTEEKLKKMGAVIETDPNYPPVVHYRMKNGLNLLILEKRYIPTVSFAMMFRVGNVDNQQGQSGLAHLFEHMAFKGTKKIGTTNYREEKKILEQIDKIQEEITAENKKYIKDEEKIDNLKKEAERLEKEAERYQVREEFWKIYNTLGQNSMNAFTSTDYTGYIVELPSDRIESFFIIESDRFKNPVLRDFYKERSVVLEELRMDKSDPSRVSWEALLSHAFIAHPYHNPTIGWEDDVANLTRKDAENFYRKFYGPNNATLAVVGDVDAVKVIELAEKYFSSWKPVKLPNTFYTKEPPQNAQNVIKVFFPAKPLLKIGFKNPGMNSPDMPALIVASEILSNGNTSRLYKRLVEEKQTALYIASYHSVPGDRYPSLFTIVSAPKGSTTVEELDKDIMDEIRGIKDNPPTKWEIEKVINNYEMSVITSLEKNLEFAIKLAYNQQIMGDWRFSWKQLEEIRKVRPEDVVQVIEKYLTPENRTAVYLIEKR